MGLKRPCPPSNKPPTHFLIDCLPAECHPRATEHSGGGKGGFGKVSCSDLTPGCTSPSSRRLILPSNFSHLCVFSAHLSTYEFKKLFLLRSAVKTFLSQLSPRSFPNTLVSQSTFSVLLLDPASGEPVQWRVPFSWWLIILQKSSFCLDGAARQRCRSFEAAHWKGRWGGWEAISRADWNLISSTGRANRMEWPKLAIPLGHLLLKRAYFEGSGRKKGK